MLKAFRPKPFIFVSACVNCKNAKRYESGYGTKNLYKCTMEESERILPGDHICDVDINDSNSKQLSWLDDIEETK